jgi:hypothetical protein
MEMTEMRITDGKGVHFTFPNGLTISIQIGGGNYSENYNEPIGRRHESGYVLPPSSTAEIAVWGLDGNMLNIDGDIVKGYVPVDRVLDFIEYLRSLPSLDGYASFATAVASFDWRPRAAVRDAQAPTTTPQQAQA